MSFIERAITLVVTAGPKSGVTFGDSKSSTLILGGYKVSAFVSASGNTAGVTANATIYGMNQSDMLALTNLAPVYYSNSNHQLTIQAGDSNSGMSVAFQGTITAINIDTSAAPNVSLELTASAFYGALRNPVPPASFSGAANAVDVLTAIAHSAGLGLENNGVTAVISNPYFSGTPLDQISECCAALQINWTVDNTKNVLAIWPKFGYRSGSVPVISPETGLIGYPRFMNGTIAFDCLYSPDIMFGSRVEVQSSFPQASGTWAIYGVDHALESITKNGDWLTTCYCMNPQLATSLYGPSMNG